MDDLIWPRQDPASDRLLKVYFDRVAPGWPRRPNDPIFAAEVADLLWTIASGIDLKANPPDLRFCAGVDQGLEAVAGGQLSGLNALAEGAQTVLRHRAATAIAFATARIVEGDKDPVIIAPSGLTRDERFWTSAIRLLHRGPIHP